MKALDLLVEHATSGPSGYISYEYSLSHGGKTLVKGSCRSGVDAEIGVDPEFLMRMNSKSARELELIAALHYLMCAGMAESDAVSAVKLHKAQQHYTDEECKKALEELRAEGLNPDGSGAC
ncbi:MAG: hypothetical protein HPY71_00070 [Firmicutes bacterium]|nr:hypothetical protein [Bacillota bacterium]